MTLPGEVAAAKNKFPLSSLLLEGPGPHALCIFHFLDLACRFACFDALDNSHSTSRVW